MEIIQDCLNDLKDNAVFVDESDDAAFREAGIPLENNDKYDFT